MLTVTDGHSLYMLLFLGHERTHLRIMPIKVDLNEAIIIYMRTYVAILIIS